MKKILLLLVILSAALITGIYYIYRNRTIASAASTKAVQHLGIIMDGNRRWARQSGKAPWLGHKQGVEPVRTTISFCLKHKIPYVTLYTFSLENFKRSKDELDYLFNILAKEVAGVELEKLFEKGVKVRFIGNRSKFPEQLVSIIHDVEEKTKDGKNLMLNILFCYGGRQEIVAAAQTIAKAVQAGTLKPEEVTEDRFDEFLWLGKIPQPDLVIRTGGLKRLSNFLPYQSAYSELLFLDCYWPEITEKHLEAALEEFSRRKRTFGA